jgi:hypothetical protein
MLAREKGSPGEDIGEQNNGVKSNHRRHTPAGGRNGARSVANVIAKEDCDE